MISVYVRASILEDSVQGNYVIIKGSTQLLSHQHVYPHTSYTEVELLTTSTALESLKRLGLHGADVYLVRHTGLRILMNETSPSTEQSKATLKVKDNENGLLLTYRAITKDRMKRMCPGKGWFYAGL